MIVALHVIRKVSKRARSVPSKGPCRQDEQTVQPDKLGNLGLKIVTTGRGLMVIFPGPWPLAPIVPQFIQHCLDVGRQGRFDFQHYAGFGMSEFQASGVQGLSCKQNQRIAGIAADFAPGDFLAPAVLPIAQHRTADVAEMHANLVRAPGFWQ